MQVVVVGAGPAGTAGALRAAELGAEVVVVEADRLGGTCVNHGCVPTRVLARTARMAREARTAATWGVRAGPVTIAWDDVRSRVAETIDLVHDAKDHLGRLEAAGVEMLVGEPAHFLGPHTLAVGDRRLHADAVLLCVGGSARRLPFDGAEHASVPDDVSHWERLPDRVAIVGSGNTGVQLVTVLRSMGAEVTLVDVAERILPPADHDVAATLHRAFLDQGVAIHTGTGIGAVRPVSGGLRVDLDGPDGDGPAGSVEVDQVVVAVGWPTRTEGLGLDLAGISHQPGRIPVDTHLRTNLPHVYAPGDANQEQMLVQSAESEAIAAATNAVLGPTRTSPHALLPWGGFTDPDIAGVGLTEEQARARDPECVVAIVPFAEMERAVIDDRTLGFCKLIADRRRSMLLGAHVIGESAVEIVQAVTTAMAAQADPATLARVEFAYPTFTAVVGEAARRLVAI